jgi:hypothetical protein
MPPSRFCLNRFAIVTLMQLRMELYRESVFCLKLISRPVAVPFGINQIFEGEATASHILIMQYFALSDYMALVFADTTGLLDRPTKVETKVSAIYEPEYTEIYNALNNRLWVDDLTLEEAIAACEEFLSKCVRLLANAKQLCSCRRPSHFALETWPIDLDNLSDQAHDQYAEACRLFNRMQDDRYQDEEEEELTQAVGQMTIEEKQEEEELDPVTEIQYKVAKMEV